MMQEPKGRHRNKVKSSIIEALEGVESGARIMVGGFGFSGNPEHLIRGVLNKGISNLTLISNNTGNLGKGLATWVNAGILSRVICSYIGNNEALHRALAEGRLQAEIMPQGTLVERMRAAGAGIPAFYTPTGTDTRIADGKERREFGGTACILEHALSADFAFIRASRADAFGNLRFWRTARNFAPIMATAARTTIVEAEQVVALGELDPDDVHLPGIFVHRVVEATQHEDPFENRTTRPRKQAS